MLNERYRLNRHFNNAEIVERDTGLVVGYLNHAPFLDLLGASGVFYNPPRDRLPERATPMNLADEAKGFGRTYVTGHRLQDNPRRRRSQPSA